MQLKVTEMMEAIVRIQHLRSKNGHIFLIVIRLEVLRVPLSIEHATLFFLMEGYV